MQLVVDAGSASSSITEVSDADYRQVFSPRTPPPPALSTAGGRVVVGLDPGGEARADVRFRVIRDGVVIADDVAGSATSVVDTGSDAGADASPCYVVETTFARSGNHSHHSAPNCFWGPNSLPPGAPSGNFERITTIDASAMTNQGGQASTEYGRFHYEPWGDAGDSLTTPIITAAKTGPHLLQVTFGNGAGDVSTGISCGIKMVRVTDVDAGVVVGSGVVVMPHLGQWERFEDSSFVRVPLEAGRRYRVVVGDDARAVNMSAFAHFRRYTGGPGGSDEVFNRVNIADVKVLQR